MFLQDGTNKAGGVNKGICLHHHLWAQIKLEINTSSTLPSEIINLQLCLYLHRLPRMNLSYQRPIYLVVIHLGLVWEFLRCIRSKHKSQSSSGMRASHTRLQKRKCWPIKDSSMALPLLSRPIMPSLSANGMTRLSLRHLLVATILHLSQTVKCKLLLLRSKMVPPP